ncbi:MAG: DUF1311 domain-containing protein [Desulfovibrio sp.]|nr:DUF1311 domain-containing protein [Desulfovibrio sp.]
MSSQISQKEKEKIRAMQRNWLKYRDQAMDLVQFYSPEGSLGRLEGDSTFKEALKTQTILICGLLP